MTTLKTIPLVGLVVALPLLAWAHSQAAAAELTTLTVRVNGPGRVLPDLDGHQLRVGSTIRLIALPSPGYIFSGWTGTTPAVDPDSWFEVVPGLELQANFMPNPFPALAGDYSGLVYTTNALAPQPIAFFTFHLSGSGKLRGKIMRAGQNYTYRLFPQFYWQWPSGPVEQDGQVQGWAFRDQLFYAKSDSYSIDVFRHDLTSELRLDFLATNNPARGTLSDARSVRVGHDWQPVPATWGADMLAYRAAFHARTNPAPQSGAYTLLLPGGDGIDQPAGAGFASLKVDAAGKLSLAGFLGDGTFFSQRASLAKDGQWPLFVRLYAARGALLGWMSFSNTPAIALGGNLLWSKPKGAQLVDAGFTNTLAALGSAYVPPPDKGPVLDFVNGVAVFSGGNLPAPLTNTFTIGADGKVLNTSSTRFSLTFIPRTGLFTGTFLHPVSGKPVPFKGAVLQSQNCGYGLFLVPDKKTGLVFIGPQPPAYDSPLAN